MFLKALLADLVLFMDYIVWWAWVMGHGLVLTGKKSRLLLYYLKMKVVPHDHYLIRN
jgi:hypothetical protein